MHARGSVWHTPVVVSPHACPRPCVYVLGDSPTARILPVEFKGGPGIVFGKDQCDRFAGLPHGKPDWALPAALFAPLNLKRSVLSDSSYSASLPVSSSLSLSLIFSSYCLRITILYIDFLSILHSAISAITRRKERKEYVYFRIW